MLFFLQDSPVNYGENYGLIQRSFMYLFDLVQERRKTITYTLSASYLEIYNEQVSNCEFMCPPFPFPERGTQFRYYPSPGGKYSVHKWYGGVSQTWLTKSAI